MPNETTLGEAIKAFIRANNLGPQLREVQIEELWAKTMGPTIGAMTRKLELRGSELTIYVDSAPLRQELSFGKDRIQQFLNEGLGGDFVKSIQVK
jgi:hypothetical protein